MELDTFLALIEQARRHSSDPEERLEWLHARLVEGAAERTPDACVAPRWGPLGRAV